MEICPVVAVLIRAKKWTKMTKITGAFHSYANVPKKHSQMPVNFTNGWFSVYYVLQ
jgi:hypothetical protein